MSAPESVTKAELDALAKLGYLHLELDGPALEAYRAGFVAGRTPPEPQVFRAGDPEPGWEVAAVVDRDADVWQHVGIAAGWGLNIGGGHRWREVLGYGPVVACVPLPDYEAAVEADRKRRADPATCTCEDSPTVTPVLDPRCPMHGSARASGGAR